MNENSFSKVKKTDQRLYGPRSLMVTGFPIREQPVFTDMLEKLGLTDLSIKFISESMAEQTLGAIAVIPDSFGQGISSNLPRAVIMSGVTENELHRIMSGYRTLGLPSQLWATLTPTSETWPLSVLLEELAAEKAAFEKRLNK